MTGQAIRSHVLSCALVVFGSVIEATAAHAQSSIPPATTKASERTGPVAGDRVRAFRLDASKPYVGEFVTSERHAVVLNVRGARGAVSTVTLPYDSLIAFDVQRQSRSMLSGTLIGAFSGIAAGAVLGLYLHARDASDPFGPDEPTSAGRGLKYPMIGLSIGASTGYLLTRPTWRPVSLMTLREL